MFKCLNVSCVTEISQELTFETVNQFKNESGHINVHIVKRNVVENLKWCIIVIRTKIIVDLNVQSEILIQKKKICWKIISQKSIHCHLKCPECNFETKEENSFKYHVMDNHPLIFLKCPKCKVGTKEENLLENMTQTIIHCHFVLLR